MYCRNRPNVISNDLKCAGGWGSAPDPAGGASDAPPDPLIVSGFAPKALAPRPLRRLKADPPSFLGTNLTLLQQHVGVVKVIAMALACSSGQWNHSCEQASVASFMSSCEYVAPD